MVVKGLFCGVSEYKNFSPLPFCKNDVLALKKAFIDVLDVDNDKIKIIAESGKIYYKEYIQKLKEFTKKSGKDDLAVIYFTGHGGIDNEGNNFLCVTDTINRKACIYFEQLINLISKAQAKSKLIILDCCHADNSYGTNIQNFNVEKAVDELYQAGISVFCACRSRQYSYPYDGRKISAFTKFICDALRYKGIYREDGLYFNDIKLLVEVYAKVWNSKNVDKIQNPVFRSNMVGTIVFPLKFPKMKEKNRVYNICTKRFNIIDLKWEVKNNADPKRKQKVFLVKMIANVDIENHVDVFVNEAVQVIKKISLPAITNHQKMSEKWPLDVILFWIGKDRFDVEEGYYKYRAVWEQGKELYWCEKLGNKRVQKKNIAYCVNESYEQLKQDRLIYVYPDDELKEFWEKNIKILIGKTEVVINRYREYENKDVTFKNLQEEAQNARRELKDTYEKVFHAYFPLPGSELKEFGSLSDNLAGLLKELVYLLTLNRDEQYIVSNFELKLTEYYQILNKWENNVV